MPNGETELGTFRVHNSHRNISHTPLAPESATNMMQITLRAANRCHLITSAPARWLSAAFVILVVAVHTTISVHFVQTARQRPAPPLSVFALPNPKRINLLVMSERNVHMDDIVEDNMRCHCCCWRRVLYALYHSVVPSRGGSALLFADAQDLSVVFGCLCVVQPGIFSLPTRRFARAPIANI